MNQLRLVFLSRIILQRTDTNSGRSSVTCLRTNNGDALVAAAAAGLRVLYEPQFIVADAIRQGVLEGGHA
jgi:DNA-binding transcriptional LysR family regulator